MKRLFARVAAIILPVVVVVATSGCYFLYPQRIPKTAPPRMQEGAQVEIETWTTLDYSPCGGSDRDCVMHHGELRKPFKRTHAKAVYGDRDLTQAQFRALVDPEFTSKIDRIKAKQDTCNHSRIPSAISAAGALGYTVLLLAHDRFGDNAGQYTLIAAGVTVAAAALSYPIGGYACRDAGKIGDSLHLDDADRTEVTMNIYGTRTDDSLIVEMQALADSFNARFGSETTASESDSGTPDQVTR